MKKSTYIYIAIILIVIAIFTLIWNYQPVKQIEQPVEDTSLINHSMIPKDSD
jgi:hypothetical protein